MSLSLSLNTAVSSLRVIETQLAVTSSNIANADSATYTRKSVDVETNTSGVSSGVTSNGIISKTNSYLLQSISEAASADGYETTNSDYLSTVEQSFGSISSSDSNGTGLTTMLSDLSSTLDDLVTTPDSDALKIEVVSDLEEISGTLQDVSNTVQDLRSQADQEIETTVDQINTLLSNIDGLNDQIIAADAAGQSTADLEDVRTAALQELSGLVDISYYAASDGSVKVFTGAGQTLLDVTVHEVSYSGAASVDADTSYETGGFEAISVNGVDITETVTSGKLKALIEQRDETLPNTQEALDTVASALIETVNDVYNQATSDSVINTLTGAETVAGTDAFSGSGSVRIAVVSAEGTVQDYQDLDLSSFATVDDVVAAVNGIPGVTATIDGEGHLVLAADDPEAGAAVGKLDSAVGAAEQGFSSYFGLNDLLTGSSASSIGVADAISDNPGLLATGTLDQSATLAAGDAAVNAGDGSIARSLYDSLAASQSFAASGSLGSINGSIADYAGKLVSTLATDVSNATTAAETASDTLANLRTNYSAQYGVNLDEETARLTELQSAYSVTAQVMSTVQEMFDSLISAVAS